MSGFGNYYNITLMAQKAEEIRDKKHCSVIVVFSDEPIDVEGILPKGSLTISAKVRQQDLRRFQKQHAVRLTLDSVKNRVESLYLDSDSK